MYYRASNPHMTSIGGEDIWVDSNLEEKVLRWLEANGFSGRWRRLEQGINVGSNNYTPDLELSVQLNGMTYRAIVEIKPFKRAFTPYISGRMRGVASHYSTDLLLLYADKEKTWYRIDKKTGALSEFTQLTPGKKQIHELWTPATIPARSVRTHKYRQAIDVMKWTLLGIANGLELGIKTIFGPKRRKSRKKTRYKNRR